MKPTRGLFLVALACLLAAGAALRGDDPLPSDARSVYEKYVKDLQEIRTKADEKIQEIRSKANEAMKARNDLAIAELQALQDAYTKAGKLDEAVAVRNLIRQLKTSLLVARPLPDPGTLEKFRDQKNFGEPLFFEVTGNPNAGTIWGTDVYTSDSTLATAAVHAGVLRPEQKGIVKVTLLKTDTSFEGSTRNGVMSYPWSSWPMGYRVEPVGKE
jgi:LCCL domain